MNQDDILLLQEPDSDRQAKLASVLGNTYTKTQLQELAQALRPLLQGRSAVLKRTREGDNRPCAELGPLFRPNGPKGDLAMGLAFFFGEEENLRRYAEAFTPEMCQLWRRVLTNVYVSEDEAKRILGTTEALIGSDRSSYYYGSSFYFRRPFMQLFSIVRSLAGGAGRYGTRENQPFITVSRLLHGLLVPVFLPEALQTDISLHDLPEGYKATPDVESESVMKYALLQGLVKGRELNIGSKGVSAGELKRAAKKLALDELFPLSGNPMVATLRSRFYISVGTLAQTYLQPSKDAPMEYTVMLRTFFGQMKKLDYYVLPLIFPHIKGFRRQFIDYNQANVLTRFLLVALAREPQRWLPLQGLLVQTFTASHSEGGSDFSALVFNPANQVYNTFLTNDYSGRYIDAATFVGEFGLTLLQSVSVMMASMGMVVLGVGDDDGPLPTPFSRIGYVRLTGLGRYVLGVDDHYEVEAPVQQALFELDPDRLIIRSLVAPNPYEQLLKDTSRPISRNRFETSAQSFLAHCVSRADVQEKIDIFRQFISNELPPLWEDFFQQLLRHCNPLSEDNTPYKLFRLSPDDKDLARLLTTDEVLRRYVILAENYLFLVRQADVSSLRDALKRHGYLIL